MYVIIKYWEISRLGHKDFFAIFQWIYSFLKRFQCQQSYKLLKTIKLILMAKSFIAKTEMRRENLKPPCGNKCQFTICVPGAICVVNPISCEPKCEYSTYIKIRNVLCFSPNLITLTTSKKTAIFRYSLLLLTTNHRGS